jgi:hypothetical protein
MLLFVADDVLSVSVFSNSDTYLRVEVMVRVTTGETTDGWRMLMDEDPVPPKKGDVGT